MGWKPWPMPIWKKLPTLVMRCTTAMPAMAASPKGAAALLSRLVATPSMTWRAKEGTPPLLMVRIILASGRRT